MTIFFQIIAILFFLFLILLLSNGGGAKRQAIRRAGMFLFMAIFAFSIFFPQVWTWVANLLGIGRGTDLLLYLLVMVFIGFVVATFRKFRSFENSITLIAREIAISQYFTDESDDKKPKRI